MKSQGSVANFDGLALTVALVGLLRCQAAVISQTEGVLILRAIQTQDRTRHTPRKDLGLGRKLRWSLWRWGLVCLGMGLLVALSPARSRSQVLTLTPSLSLSERYDDNIFQSRIDEEDDFVTALTPGISLLYIPSPTTELDLEYHTTFEFFAENEDQNQISHRGALHFAAPLLSFVSIDLRDTLILTEEPVDRELPIEDATGLRPGSTQRRERTLRNQAEVAFDIQLLTRWALGVSSSVLIDDVDVPNELDELRYSVGAELGYVTDIARDSRLGVAYELAFHTFSENGPGAPELEDADFEVHSIMARFRHALSPTLSGDVAAGYAFVNSDDPELDGEAGPVASLRLVKALRDGQAVLSYRRYFRSGGGVGGVVTADTGALAMTAPLSPKIAVRLGTNLSFFDFAQETTRGGDRLFAAVRAGLTYQVLHFWRLLVDYAFEYTDFTDDDADRPNRYDQRLVFASQLTLREGLLLSLTYDYSTRDLDDGTTLRDVEDFDRNRVTLALTYAPTFRFYRPQSE